MGRQASDTLEKVFRQSVITMTGLMVFVGIFYLGSLFYALIVLLGLAVVMTYILLGPVNWMEKGLLLLGRSVPKVRFLRESNDLTRGFTIIIVYVVFFFVLTLASVKLVPVVSRQLNDFAMDLPRYFVQVEIMLIDWTDQTFGTDALKRLFEKDIQEAEKQGVVLEDSPNGVITEKEKQIIHQSVLRNAVAQISQLTEKALTSALSNVANMVTNTVNGFIYTIAGLLLVFYFLLDGRRLRDRLRECLPQNVQGTADYFTSRFHEVMFAFIKGQLMLGILTGVYMFIIYSIFGVEYAIFLGTFLAIAELLPVVGTWIGLTPGILVMLFSEDPLVVIPVWLCSYAFQTVKDNILAPKVVGDVMGLHPVVVIFALIVCAKFAGLVGVLLALPLASILNIILHHFNRDDGTEPEGQPA